MDKIDPRAIKGLDEFYQEEVRRAEKEAKLNSTLLETLREKLGTEYVEDILECLKECEANGELDIVPDPGIDRQEEDWGSFDHIIVDQYVNGGYVGDEYAGWVYIPVQDGLYLKSHYNM